MSEKRFVWLGRYAFVLTVLYAGGMFWLVPHPPMADLPQHAGQVALWRDLLLDESPWQSLMRINYFTPYLLGYGLALVLSFLIPIAAALKLLLMLAYYAFVFGCVKLRRHFQGDHRLDWLFIPGFFGAAYVWGMFSFLIAAPIGLAFVLLADRYATTPTKASGVVVCLLGVLLFFSHGLVFLFACAIGIAFLVVRQRRLARLCLALLPYVPLGTLSIIYALMKRESESFASTVFPPGEIFWGWDLRRLVLPGHIFGGYDLQGAVFAGTATVLMLWAPRLLASKLNLREPSSLVPMAMFLLVWLVMPFYAMQITFLYLRFALFALPFYALVFCRTALPIKTNLNNDMQPRVAQWMMALLCWIFLAGMTDRLVRFAQETKDYETVQAAAEPGQRALALIFDADSPASKNPWAYLHYPLWYQAERRGLVDFNFAWALPMVVHYEKAQRPPVDPDWESHIFDWSRHGGKQYRYFFIRNTQPLPVDLFKNDQCHVELLKSAGHWSIYEASRCH